MKLISSYKKDFELFNDIKGLFTYLNLPTAGINEESGFSMQDLTDVHLNLPYSSGFFRPNFFSFVFVKDAYGIYENDDITLDAIPGSIYFGKPGQRRSYAWTKINMASLITVNEFFLKENVHKDIFREFPFLLSEPVGYLVLNQKEYLDFEIIYEQIQTEYRSKNPYRKRVIGRLFIILLFKLKGYFLKDLPDWELSKDPSTLSFFNKVLDIFSNNNKNATD